MFFTHEHGNYVCARHMSNGSPTSQIHSYISFAMSIMSMVQFVETIRGLGRPKDFSIPSGPYCFVDTRELGVLSR